MKRKPIYNILAVLITATIFITACTKENTEVKLDPKLTTSQVLDVTSNSAIIVGFVVAEGAGFTEKGVCYDTDTLPTIAKSKVVYTGEKATATFDVLLSGLNFATKYYARAYATNASGTMYGKEYTFTTLPILPTVSTTAITEIAGTTATTGGNVTATGGADVTARGVIYGLTDTTMVNKTTDGTGTGEFVSLLKNLQGLTTYYVQAYATNSAGTAYGEILQFTTLVSIRHWNVPGDYVADSYPGSSFANWDPANSPQIQSLESSSDQLEGYVYMANGSNSWKIASKPNWDGPNYGDGGPGVLSATGDNINSPAGYYKINVNAIALTYTAVATNWGVIGDATPNGWNDETALTYFPELRSWRGGMHLTANSFKFRANHSWDYNYGATAGESSLKAGGDNIAVDLEADYYFTLDLSNPNAYTYNASRWGVIGSATADGWNSDQNMTWDATNKVLTATLPLVVGEIKFRANDAWDLNYGGDPNALTAGGANIPINTAGTYTITLDLSKVNPSCTIVAKKK